ncbi:Ribonuclease HIII [anaerobic digester metagenome]
MIAGVDEAGKGAVLGPLVVAALAAPDWEAVREVGRRDSKALTPRQRDVLYDEIIGVLPFAVVERTAAEIDSGRRTESMNAIVAGAHASALRQLVSSGLAIRVAYLDACDVREGRYATEVGRRIGGGCTVLASHRADSTLPIVASASIVAKVRRDRAIEALSTEYGPIGSGYPSDPVTRRFIDALLKEQAPLPSMVRASWRTISDRRPAPGQTMLV